MNDVRACAMLLACPDPASRTTLKLGCVLAAIAAGLAAWLGSDPNHAARLGAMLWGFAVMIVWTNAGPTGEALRREAQATCLPAIGRTVALAWALLGLITLLGPALLLDLRGDDVAQLGGLLVLIAALGSLVGSIAREDAPVPLRSVLAAIIYSPVVILVELRYQHDSDHTTSRAWLVATLLVSLLILRWRWLARRNARAEAASTPFSSRRDGRTDWLEGFSYRPTVAHLHSSDPRLGMRALLGSPFAPLSWQQRYVLRPLAIVALPGFAVWLNWFMGVAKSQIMSSPLEMSLYIGWMLFFLRLRGLFGPRRNGATILPVTSQQEELTELALLPAWNDAGTARRLLLRSVLQPPLAALAGVVLAAAMLAAGLRADPMAFLVLLLAFAGLALAAIASTLRILSRQPMTFWSLALFAPCVIAWFITIGALTAAFVDRSGMSAADVWVTRVAVLAWLVSFVSTGLLAREAWRRFNEHPHPFLAT